DFGWSEVRLCLLDNASQGFKCLAMPIHDGSNARVERYAAQVLEPGHAYTLEVAVERAREMFPRFVDRERRAGIGPRDGAEYKGEVGHRASEASGRTEREPTERRFGVRHPANRRAEARHVAECRWITE